MEFEHFPDPYDADFLQDTTWNFLPVTDVLAIPLPLGAELEAPLTDDFFFDLALPNSDNTPTASRFTELPLGSGNDPPESQDAWTLQQTHGPALGSSQQVNDPLPVALAEPLEWQQLVVSPISASPRRYIPDPLSN